MKYLFVYRYSKNDQGGIEQIINSLDEYLAKHKLGEVFVLSNHPDHQSMKIEQHKNFTILGFNLSNIIKILFSKGFDHLCIFEPYYLYTKLALLMKVLHPSLKISIIFCGTRTETEHKFYKIIRFYFKIFKKTPFNHYIAVSEYAKNIAVSRSGIENLPVKVVYNPIDNSEIKKATLGSARFITVGRICKRKNYDDLLLAFKKIKQNIPEAQLDIIGGVEPTNVEFLKKISNLAYEYGIDDSMKMWIDIPDKKKFELLAKASIYFTTSIHEMFGISTAEAMAAGLPIIAYGNTATEEIVKLAGGILVTDYEGMASEATKLFKDKDKMKTLSNSAINFAKSFEKEKICVQFLKSIN